MIFLITILFFVYCGQEDSKIKDLCFEWSEKLNERNLDSLIDFYSDQVDYYGNRISKYDVLNQKNDFVKKHLDFSQDIIKMKIIKVTSKPNEVLVTYEKETIYNGKKYLIDSKLRWRLNDEKWEIVEEDDNQILSAVDIAQIEDDEIEGDEIFPINQEVLISTELDTLYTNQVKGTLKKSKMRHPVEMDKWLSVYTLNFDKPLKINEKFEGKIDLLAEVERLQVLAEDSMILERKVNSQAIIKGVVYEAPSHWYLTDFAVSVEEIE